MTLGVHVVRGAVVNGSVSASLVERMKRIDPGVDYYAFTLLESPDGTVVWSCPSTYWVGYKDDKPGREIRRAGVVIAENVAHMWDTLGEGYWVVNDDATLSIFLRLGGNVLMASTVAEARFPQWLEAREVAFAGATGFKSLESVPQHALQRAPSPKQRMRVFKRDGLRCRVCGRRPDDHTDLELHIHHIRPWGRGGFTEDENLITLCHTCHKGLEPHADITLYQLIDPEAFSPRAAKELQEYVAGVTRYRARVIEMLRAAEPSSKDDA